MPSEGPEAAPVRLFSPEERDPSRESADAGADEGAAPEPAVRADGVPASRPAPPPEVPDEDRLTVPGAPDDDRPAVPGVPDDRVAEPEVPDGEPGVVAPGVRAPLVRVDRWTVGDAGAVAPDLVRRAACRPAEEGGRSGAVAEGSAGSSASAGRTARSSSGPPGDVEGRAEPGRVTPWMRPTGAEGSTACPSSPCWAGFCHEASRARNRSPSLTPIEARATVTSGGATRRQPPSQPPPSDPELPPEPGPAPGPLPLSSSGVPGVPVPTEAPDPAANPSPPRPPSGRPGAPGRRRSARRSQSPSPTRSPAFVDAGVDPRYLPHPLLTLRVGEVENVLTLPMEVVGDVRDLLPQPGKRVRHDSPRRPPERSTSNDPWHSGQVTAACVWPSLLIRR
ncbi:hypothetical protein SCALM49S_05090 [Streptomyces californicus]